MWLRHVERVGSSFEGKAEITGTEGKWRHDVRAGGSEDQALASSQRCEQGGVGCRGLN